MAQPVKVPDSNFQSATKSVSKHDVVVYIRESIPLMTMHSQ